MHHQGTCLSQAFARNLVRCPDGEVACIDFEDDPAAVLPLAVCHVRDALCYAHSTAIYLHASGTLTEGRERWAAWVAQGSEEMAGGAGHQCPADGVDAESAHQSQTGAGFAAGAGGV